MRILLDANLSPARIGRPLTARGHDVLSLAADAALGAMADPDVLEFAAAEQRILVTRNSRDFAPLARAWAEAGRHHAGCILVWTLQHHEFGRILERLDEVLAARPDPTDWVDLTMAI